jgi:putative hydrolase of the HAD superfamily
LHYSNADAYDLFPDVAPCVSKLSAAGVVIGVLSDFDIRLQGILQGLGVASHFQFIVQSFVEGYSKPSRELWEVAKERAGGVQDGWHVGDDPKKDAFDEATVIILDRQNDINTGFRKVTSLEQLPELLNLP